MNDYEPSSTMKLVATCRLRAALVEAGCLRERMVTAIQRLKMNQVRMLRLKWQQDGAVPDVETGR